MQNLMPGSRCQMQATFERCNIIVCAVIAFALHAGLLCLWVPKTTRALRRDFERLSVSIVRSGKTGTRLFSLQEASGPVKKKGLFQKEQKTLKKDRIEKRQLVYKGFEVKSGSKKRYVKKEKIKKAPQKLPDVQLASQLKKEKVLKSDFEGYSVPGRSNKKAAKDGMLETASISETTTDGEGNINKALDGGKRAKPAIVYASPKYKENPPPPYPRIARRRGYEGQTYLRIEVLKNGKVGRIEVATSSGFEVLDKAAVKAVREWTFTPGSRNGKKTKQWVVVPVRFQLQ